MTCSSLSADRRSFLRASGALVALLFLESLARANASRPPVRTVALCYNMGFVPAFFFPKTDGRNYEHSRYTALLQEHTEHFTVLSGMAHPDGIGGHKAERSFLSAAPRPSDPDFKNTISMDQLAVNALGKKTRFPSLILSVGRDANNDYFPSIVHNGVVLPAQNSPAALYRKLFVKGTREEVARRTQELTKGASILDFVRESARTLQRDLPANDKQTLDQYFTAVRDLEKELEHSQSREQRAKPTVSLKEPVDVSDPQEVEKQTDLMLALRRVALETDSTRIITLAVYQGGVTPKIPGVQSLTYALTHHGNDPAKMEELSRVESTHFQCLSRFLSGLRAAQDGGKYLLDSTMVLHGSHLGNANLHTNTDLPLLLAGGPFRHGQHLAFGGSSVPFANLFVNMLQAFGQEISKFGSGSSTLRGWERA